ncbi:MAG: hypothetical protein VX104_02235 [Planctomycetota bacterium]|nr:hypothetical protein [Planctomycetota bacterium]
MRTRWTLLLLAGCGSVPLNEENLSSRPATSALNTTRVLSVNPGQSSVSQVPMTALKAINTDIEIAPWSFAGKSGRVMSTDHYLIRSNIRYERVMDRLPILLEHAIFRYQTAFGTLPEPKSTLDTYVLGDRNQWLAKTRQVLPQQAESLASIGRGGFAVNGTGYLYYIDWAGRDRDTFAIAVHEGWHQYVQSTFREDIPSWLDEGIATYMEGLRFRPADDNPAFRPWDNWERRRRLRDSARSGRLIPLEDLLDRPVQSFIGSRRNEELLGYYAQVWALALLLADQKGPYRDGFEQMLQDAANGGFRRKVMNHPAVISRGGRGRNAHLGRWAAIAYFGDLEELKAAYKEKIRDLTS